MYKPAEGINLKIVRAEQHLRNIKAEMEQYYEAMDQNPNVVRIKDMGEGWSITLGEVLQPPMMLAAIVGDCVLNLRAPLDYIRRAIHERQIRRQLSIDEESPNFPIYTDETKFGADKNLRSDKIPEDILVEIKAVQPFPNNPDYLSLAYLRALTNRDKHRLPLLTTIVGGRAFARLGIGREMTAQAVSSVSLSKLMLPPGYIPRRADMDIELAGFVALNDPGMPREPLDVTLENILITVRDRVITRFLPFLGEGA